MKKIKFITLLKRMKKLPDFHLCHRGEEVLGLTKMDSLGNEDFISANYPEYYHWIIEIGQKYNPFEIPFEWGDSWQCSFGQKEIEIDDKIKELEKEKSK